MILVWKREGIGSEGPMMARSHIPGKRVLKTLPKALRTQALTALTSNCGLVGLVQYAWKAMFDLVW